MDETTNSCGRKFSSWSIKYQQNDDDDDAPK